ncbi:MAG: PilZ domain-containing protein [Thermodesulfobacteriota bacterium]
MKKRPLSIVIISLIYLLEPFGNIFQAAFVNDIPLIGETGILSRLVWTDWVVLGLFPVVAVGVYLVRKWGWYLFIGFSGLLVVYNIYVYLRNPNYAPETILLFILIITGTSAVFLRRHVYAPYFNPRLRWWETAARYRIVLETTILTDAGAQPCKTVDISETGCFLETRVPLAEGASVWLKIRCRGMEINCLGKVVRRAGGAETVLGYGIMFQGMAAEARNLLRKLLFSLERLDRMERKDLISASEIPTDLWRRNYTSLSRLFFRVKSSLRHTLSYKPKRIEHSA